eukprot:CAMPEP_0119088048 /NCGR_PEP_ID=MMETSP1178-20130426/144056_1 /TAXON_ID=33656 /ORGANISM="unid sp, Strain CCMP2000" /LENGTH=259 /DNA_ID=CAMNT_0007071303 /DNA_START=154 /DNA_END=933 /DNA_ORIENTATION=+
MRPENKLVADLAATDARTIHVREVLRAENGQAVRAGVIDMGRSDAATVRWVGAGGKDPALRLELGAADELLCTTPELERPRVDLLLAMPRPLQFGRLLPMISSLGVGTLWVTEATKTEKMFFSSHLLRKGNEAELRAALVQGVAQAGDTAVPRVIVQRNMRRLVAEELGGYAQKLVCHPAREAGTPTISSILRGLDGKGRVLLAVGPEGGWEEPRELELLQDSGFRQVTLGRRTLRTDVAVVSLLAVTHESLTLEKVAS